VKTINCWRDLEEFGIVLLTAEACGLSWRLLCDVTEQGAATFRKCFGLPRDAKLGEPWNRGSAEHPHIGSVMVTQEMLPVLGVFALLEAGCPEVHLLGGSVVGIEPDDPPETVELMRKSRHVEHSRRFSYGGTAGDRNRHEMTGRIE
jgi:hypothetical protein